MCEDLKTWTEKMTAITCFAQNHGSIAYTTITPETCRKTEPAGAQQSRGFSCDFSQCEQRFPDARSGELGSLLMGNRGLLNQNQQSALYLVRRGRSMSLVSAPPCRSPAYVFAW